jgi:hypothetical protein
MRRLWPTGGFWANNNNYNNNNHHHNNENEGMSELPLWGKEAYEVLF